MRAMRVVKKGLIVAALLAAGPGLAVAQFHQKDKSGQPVARQNPSTRVTPSIPVAPGGQINPSTYSRDDLAAAAPVTASIPSNNAAPNANDFASVWGYAIHHGDGSYTKSKQDYETHQLTQETFSANGTLLLTRRINLDEQGKPAEVLIYNGYNELRYRGVLIYDRLGRFQEELIFDTQRNLLRKRIQEFDSSGNAQVKVIDLTDKIPPDLQLVISEKTEVDPEVAKKAMKDFQEQATKVKKDEEADRNSGDGKKRGFFRGLFRGND